MAIDTRTPRTSQRWHPAWTVAAVTLGALVAAAAFRSSTGVLIEPIESEFGWTRATTSGAVSLNLVLYGLAAPRCRGDGALRSAARRHAVPAPRGAGQPGDHLHDRPVAALAALGLRHRHRHRRHGLVFGAIVANRWFHTHRGLVMGVFSAANATGQLIFLPAIAWVPNTTDGAPRHTSPSVSPCSCPSSSGSFSVTSPPTAACSPYGVAEGMPWRRRPRPPSPRAAAIRVLRQSSRSWAFWALVLTFWVCGWSTNGLIQTHFIPAAHDHGMAQTTAAGLLALVGIFDVLGTVASGWLTDRMDSRVLLAIYYGGRGLSLLAIDAVLAPHVEPGMWVFIVFYGLDWVATVPPTVALCRQHFGIRTRAWSSAGCSAPMVGAGIGASIAGWIRTASGSYHSAWLLAAALCFISVGLALSILQAPHDCRTRPRPGTGSTREAIEVGDRLVCRPRTASWIRGQRTTAGRDRQ